MNVRRSWLNMSLVALLLVLGAAPVAQAAGSSRWLPPENLTGWQPSLGMYRLEAGTDGTLVVAWWAPVPNVLPVALHARVREPGVSWSPDQVLSERVLLDSVVEVSQWGAKVAPDGTVWVAWAEIDDTQPAGNDNRRVMAAYRAPGGAWQTDWVSLDPLPGSGYETEIRSTDLAVGPDGDVVVAWVACATDIGSASQGPCALKVRRRLPGAADWKDIERVDGATGMGIWPAYVLVGPGGLTVVVWMEANPADSSQWKVRAARWASRTASWQRDDDVSDGWFTPWCFMQLSPLVQPVMGEDGMVVAAWTVMTKAPTYTSYTHYSATLGRSGGWGTPAQISLPSNNLNYVSAPRLSFRGGVTVAAWEQWDASGHVAVYANARDAGGTWNPLAEERISPASLTSAWILDLQQWPGGTAVVLWSGYDNARPVGTDEALFWSGRPPGGAWDGAGQGQFGDWVSSIEGGALALTDDGSGATLWGIRDSSLPADQQGVLLVAGWPPGGPAWSLPEVLDEGYQLLWPYYGSVTAIPGQRSVAAAWWVNRATTDPNAPTEALFFTKWASRVYLPLLLRNAH